METSVLALSCLYWTNVQGHNNRSSICVKLKSSVVETEVKQIDLHLEQLKDGEWQVRDVSDYIIAHSACNIRVKRCENPMYVRI